MEFINRIIIVYKYFNGLFIDKIIDPDTKTEYLNNDIINNYIFKYCKNIFSIINENDKFIKSIDFKNEYFDNIKIYIKSLYKFIYVCYLLKSSQKLNNTNIYIYYLSIFNDNILKSYQPINFKDEINYYFNYFDDANKEDKSLIYYKSYMSNIFIIFTQIYQSFINETNLENILKFDFINILPLIHNYELFYQLFNYYNDNLVYDSNIIYILSDNIKLNNYYKYVEFMYSLFMNNDEFDENIKQLLFNLYRDDNKKDI